MPEVQEPFLGPFEIGVVIFIAAVVITTFSILLWYIFKK